ncbi:gliding motility lipoprotein GldH [Robertkochia marina]|uniref:Gliding motility lipoprotein GldH n=1 Tax=Robertkochia marina TaxID=1227945 RepID=A0A4S3M4W3_9FLAO|nr:gliding motility lipoprotein GldH [Robertkochia marina]THD69381.1 gliding motility lipoprotein GldH [Robertkochia marina]TRZ47359.1 gliding motility lipoprotein GldH [Robertkochia marina]
MHRAVILLGLLIMLGSCSGNNIAFAEYKTIGDGWDKDQAVNFNFRAPDTLNRYNLFINLRNDEKFSFSNIFLIVDMEFPQGKVITDTLEYEMARPDGEWLGKGFTDLKENKLWYKEAVQFPDTGSYEVKILHAMRKNGNVEGVRSLQGITDVGISIERLQ